MSRNTVKAGASVALAAITLLGLAACSDPGAAAEQCGFRTRA